MIYQYTKTGSLVDKYTKINEIIPLFDNKKRTVNTIRSTISRCLNNKQKSAYGYIWKRDKKVKKQSKKKSQEPIYETELQVLLQRSHAKSKEHEIICFSKTQAEEFVKLIKKRFKKHNWEVEWYYNLKYKVYVVECKRK